MDPDSVIILGHRSKQPLICPSSELLYGLEPHDYIYSAVPHRTEHGVDCRGGGVYPGWCRLVGTGRGTIPGTVLSLDLTLI